MIQGAASAASLTRPVSQSRTEAVQQDSEQQGRQAAATESDTVELQSSQSAGGSAFETAQQVLEAKTQMVEESLNVQKQTLDLLA